MVNEKKYLYKREGIIYLTGDKEFEAVYNYWIKMGRTPNISEEFHNFAINYLNKYSRARIILAKGRYGYFYTVVWSK